MSKCKIILIKQKLMTLKFDLQHKNSKREPSESETLSFAQRACEQYNEMHWK